VFGEEKLNILVLRGPKLFTKEPHFETLNTSVHLLGSINSGEIAALVEVQFAGRKQHDSFIKAKETNRERGEKL